MSESRRSTDLLLALASVLAMLLAFEAGFRVRAHLHNRGVLGAALDSAIEVPHEGPVSLGHMIRGARNPRIVYELKPGLSVVYQGGRVSTDERGFRRLGPSDGRPPSVAVAGEVFRILGIGDSFMFGQGVDDEECYLAVLEAELARRRPERRWRVTNTAVPGYNTAMEVETLQEKGLEERPQVVIVEFVANDLGLPNFIRRRQPLLSLEKSFLVDFFRQRQLRQLPGTWLEKLERSGLVFAPRDPAVPRRPDSDPDRVPPEYRDMVGWEGYRAAMTELARLSEEHGFEVISTSLAPNRSADRLRALELSRSLGFHVLDVGSVFLRYLESEGYSDYLASPLALSAKDGHPSAIAHRIAANEILELLLGEIVPDPGPSAESRSGDAVTVSQGPP